MTLRRVYVLAFALALHQGSASAQEHPYVPLGPHFYVAASVGEALEYRDIVLAEDPAINTSVGATLRGFSVSMSHNQDVTTSERYATEGLAAYSHKLPLIDVQLGAVFIDVTGLSPSHRTGGRIAIATNQFSRAAVGLVYDNGFSDGSHGTNIFAVGNLYRGRRFAWSVRVSGSDFAGHEGTATGVSARVVGLFPVTRRIRASASAGIIHSRIAGSSTTVRSVPIAAIGFEWSY